MRVALDSSVFIYALKSQDEWSEHAHALLTRINSGELNGVASSLCLAEVLVKPMMLTPEDGLDAQLFMEGVEHLDYFPADTEIAIRSSLLRASHGRKLKLIDALHLATAEWAGADVFVTNDRDMATLKLKDLKIKLLGEPLD
jgi:predicted nucleic acid-binding protein